MKNIYYIGYLRDPDEVITDGFQKRKEIKAILYRDNDNDFREVLSQAKVFFNEFTTIDWNRVFNSESTLVGRLDNQISFEEAKGFFLSKSREDLEKYIVELKRIISSSKEKAITGHQEYEETEKEFIKAFRGRNGRKN